MDVLGHFIDNGAMLPNTFAFDSGFVDKFMQCVLNAMVLPRLWQMAYDDVKPAVLSTGLPCDAPWETYGLKEWSTGPYIDRKQQESLAVCYNGERYYLVGANGEASHVAPIDPIGALPPLIMSTFSPLKGTDRLDYWGFSKEGIVER